MLATSALSPPTHEPPWTRTIAGRTSPRSGEVCVHGQYLAVGGVHLDVGPDLDAGRTRRGGLARRRRRRGRRNHQEQRTQGSDPRAGPGGEPIGEARTGDTCSQWPPILVLSNMYPPHHMGGYELSCRDVVDRWRAKGHDVTVLTSTMRASRRRRSSRRA